jgi:hypothetical protein
MKKIYLLGKQNFIDLYYNDLVGFQKTIKIMESQKKDF